MNAPFPFRFPQHTERSRQPSSNVQPDIRSSCKTAGSGCFAHSPSGEHFALASSLPDLVRHLSIPQRKYCLHDNVFASESCHFVRTYICYVGSSYTFVTLGQTPARHFRETRRDACGKPFWSTPVTSEFPPVRRYRRSDKSTTHRQATPPRTSKSYRGHDRVACPPRPSSKSGIRCTVLDRTRPST